MVIVEQALVVVVGVIACEQAMETVALISAHIALGLTLLIVEED